MKFTSSLLSLLICINGGEAWFTNTAITRSRVSSSLKSSTSSFDFNVVFKPSNDPEAFDSHKIGVSRVHRYSRDDSGGDSEYVMWYVVNTK